jgi:hypothetical protein
MTTGLALSRTVMSAWNATVRTVFLSAAIGVLLFQAVAAGSVTTLILAAATTVSLMTGLVIAVRLRMISRAVSGGGWQVTNDINRAIQLYNDFGEAIQAGLVSQILRTVNLESGTRNSVTSSGLVWLHVRNAIWAINRVELSVGSAFGNGVVVVTDGLSHNNANLFAELLGKSFAGSAVLELIKIVTELTDITVRVVGIFLAGRVVDGGVHDGQRSRIDFIAT